jgi:SAM-dependent methyltransferase
MEYSEKYFNWQKNIGAFGGLANIFKFKNYISESDNVLDFGCGGGYLLQNIKCYEKIGVEINQVAREEGQRHGLTIYSNIDEVPDSWANVIISNHTLEHVNSPLSTIKALLPKLQLNGKAVFVVPHQKPNEPYHENDRNQHLYTWNPLTLGNLFKAAGYQVIEVDVIRHLWPRNYTNWYAKLGQKGFDYLCRLYAFSKRNYQIRVVAKK